MKVYKEIVKFNQVFECTYCIHLRLWEGNPTIMSQSILKIYMGSLAFVECLLIKV